MSFVAGLPQDATFEIHAFASTDGRQRFNEDLGCARAVNAVRLITTAKKAFKGISRSRITAVVNHGPVTSTTNPVSDLRSVVIKVAQAEVPELILPKPETPKTPVGPKPAPGAPAGICDPFPTTTEALQALVSVKISLAVLLTGSLDDPDVKALWNTYLSTPKKGTKGTLPPRKVFSNGSTKLVQQFETDPETVQQRRKLMKLLGEKVPKAGLVPGQVGAATVPLPLRTVLADADLLDLPMSFKEPTKRIPGLIAGGPGKNASDAGDDVRNVDGKFVVTNLGSGTFRVAAAFTFDVFDAVDFCPGNPGGFFAQLLITKDMSQLEATPDFPTYDTPFEVIYTIIDDETF